MHRNLILLLFLASNLAFAQGAPSEGGSQPNFVESAKKLLREEQASPQPAPGKLFVGKDTPSSRVVALYVGSVEDKLRRIGNLTLQPTTERSTGGTVVIQLEIRPDGVLEDIRVIRSSGSVALDDSAVRVVRMSAPFSAFPPELKAQATSLVLVRFLSFPPSQVH
jgi:protein TonB